jgi:hypothetical protein
MSVIQTLAMNASNLVNKIICWYTFFKNLATLNPPNKYYFINHKYCSIIGVWLVEKAVVTVPSFTPLQGASAPPRLADLIIFSSFFQGGLLPHSPEISVQFFVLRSC